MYKKVTETLSEVKDNIVSIEKTMTKMEEKMEEANMAQKRDKEAGELQGAKAESGE